MAIAIAAVGNQRYTCELVIRRFACIALQRLCARDCASIPPVNRAVQCWLVMMTGLLVPGDVAGQGRPCSADSSWGRQRTDEERKGREEGAAGERRGGGIGDWG